MNLILLCGGSGSRLWPLATEARSKQFIKIYKKDDGSYESMVQRSCRLIKKNDPDAKIVFASSKAQGGLLRRQLGDDIDVTDEPDRRDTFPAIVLAAAYLHDVKGISEEESVVVCPIDAYADEAYYKTLQKLSDCSKSANLTLMGINPTYPSEKYGYILLDSNGNFAGFKEKPDVKTAEEYLKKAALWNGGVFGFKLSYILNKAKELFGICAYSELIANYSSLTKISFDYAVAEKEKDIAVVRYGGAWSDLGTWNTFSDFMNGEHVGKVTTGEGCENICVINETDIPLVALGIKNAAIVATHDGILVCDREASPKLKPYIPDERPMAEERLWGDYKVLDQKITNGGQNYLTKELIILPGKNISYQKHNHRAEVWTFVQGEGILVLDGKEQKVGVGDVAYIKPKMMHAVKAISELHIIEVQLGSELIEEDIERFEYEW